MVTSTFAFPGGFPNGSANWSTNFQNPYGSVLIAPSAQKQAGIGYNNGCAATSRPTHSNPDVSGYLHSQGKARDDYHGKYLEYVLQAKDIHVENAPPFRPVTAQAGYANHGVVKINNVSLSSLFHR